MLFSSLIAKGTCNDWFTDSGASAHMTMKRTILCNVKPTSGNVTVANSSKMAVECSGEVHLKHMENDLTLKNVLFVPDLCTNLVSVSQMIKNGNRVIFGQERCEIKNKFGEIIATASLVDDMYKLDLDCSSTAMLVNSANAKAVQSTSFTATQKTVPIDCEIWHRRLGHVAKDTLHRMQHVADGISVSKSKSSDPCVVCAKGKQTRANSHTRQKNR